MPPIPATWYTLKEAARSVWLSRQSLSQTWIDKGRLPHRRDYKRQIYIDPAVLAAAFRERFQPLPADTLAAHRQRLADPLAEPAPAATPASLADLKTDLAHLQARLAEETQRRHDAEKLTAWLQGLTEQLTLQNTRLLAMPNQTAAPLAPRRPGILARLFRRR